MKLVSLSQLIKNTAEKLRSLSDTPRLDAEILLLHILNKPHAYLYTHPEALLTQRQQQTYQELLQQRMQGIPVAYILGKKEFWTMELIVNRHVLIPRPETELLVEKILELLPKQPSQVVADLGTGSGAIALALAKERPHWIIYASDIDSQALDVARINAKNLGIKNVKFLLGDWYQSLPAIRFDAIISNPPYIAASDPALEQPVRQHEPQRALIAAANGLESIVCLVEGGKNHLKSGAILMLEHGYQQGAEIAALMQAQSYYAITTIKDLAGKDRVTYAKSA